MKARNLNVEVFTDIEKTEYVGYKFGKRILTGSIDLNRMLECAILTNA